MGRRLSSFALGEEGRRGDERDVGLVGSGSSDGIPAAGCRRRLSCLFVFGSRSLGASHPFASWLMATTSSQQQLAIGIFSSRPF